VFLPPKANESKFLCFKGYCFSEFFHFECGKEKLLKRLQFEHWKEDERKKEIKKALSNHKYKILQTSQS
jgi:hypothetical protein